MTQANLELDSDNAVYRTLLESTKAIPWKIDWATMRFTYIGPQIESLLGWRQDSWLTVDDWVTRMHPEDRDYVVNFCVSQSQAGIDHEADYRALTKDNGYVWIRDVVHVVRNAQGEVESLIGFMFDISDRKRAEDELLKLQRELLALSYQDGLTGVGNRRKFEEALETEWASARRNQQPLAIILLDVDYFKQYNDHHGHLEGDDCLKAIARALARTVTRPRDLVARYGGEEFVLLLPETDLDAARQLAEECQQAIAALALPHAASAVSSKVTISLGVTAVVPTPMCAVKDVLAATDQLLYRAKRNGRNQIALADCPIEAMPA